MTEGDLPSSYTTIHQEMMAKHKAQNANRNEKVDYLFEIAVTLAEEQTGYIYSQTIPSDLEKPFQVLFDRNKRQLPFWKKLFR